jgi:hypothetical protein
MGNTGIMPHMFQQIGKNQADIGIILNYQYVGHTHPFLKFPAQDIANGLGRIGEKIHENLVNLGGISQDQALHPADLMPDLNIRRDRCL